jgi:uncharacterized RDD family membrane protein YckC
MTERQYGGFWRRFIAYFIDKIILYFLSVILVLIGLLALGLRGDMINNVLISEDITQGMGSIFFLYLVASLLTGMTYFTWFHGMGGRTPGKMLLGLRVIQASNEPMTPGIAFLRWVGYLISGPVFCLGFLWVAFDGRKQGWHDKIAATLVIRDSGESDGGTRAHSPENPAYGSTAPAGIVSGVPPSACEPVVSVPPPEEQPEKACADDSLPRL